jgi:hypothetical protein
LAEWVTAANDICRDGFDDRRALGLAEDDPAAEFQAIPQLTAIYARVNQDIAELERPPQYEEKIARLIEVATRSNIAFQQAYQAWGAGDTVSSQRFVDEGNALVLQIQQLDAELGANVCALG